MVKQTHEFLKKKKKKKKKTNILHLSADSSNGKLKQKLKSQITKSET